MGTLKINERMWEKWSSRLLGSSEGLTKKSYTNIFSDDKEFFISKNSNLIVTSKKKKIFGSDSDFIEEREHFFPKTNSRIIYSPKYLKKFYGGGSVHYETSINDLIIGKSLEEVTLKNTIKSLSETIEEVLGTKRAAENYIDFTKLKLDDLNDLFLRHRIDTHSCAQIANDYESFINAKNRLRAINHRIQIVLNKIRQFGRNLKEHFTKNHSFHFKNLDDYHSLILINRFELIKV